VHVPAKTRFAYPRVSKKRHQGSGCGCRKLNSVPADHWHLVTPDEGPVMLRILPFQGSGPRSWHSNHLPTDSYKASVKDKTKTQHQLLGSFSNDDDDINEGRKAIGLDWKINSSARASRFFVHFFAVTARPRRSRFLEDVSTSQTLSFSFPELRYNRFLQKNCQHLTN